MQSELDLLKQERARLLARITELEQIAEDKNKLEVRSRVVNWNISLKTEISVMHSD
ncbi:11556_t:CDS:1, partial [Diversispora eburnea]